MLDVLTKDQLKEIAEIIERHIGVMVRTVTGEGEVDKNLLRRLGIPVDAASAIESSFVLGKIVQLMEDSDLKKISFNELKERAKNYSLSVVERNSLEFAKRNAAKYVTALGQKIERDITSNIDRVTYDATLEMVEKNAIRDKVKQAIIQRQSKSRLVSELGRELKDWKRDWKRVAHTELWNAKLQGEVITILQGDSIYGETQQGDTKVFRRPSTDACSHCKRLYLESDGVTPKIFKLKELINNGTNVGKKVSDWKPITGTTHPNCFVNGKVKVFTVSGYKQIKDIKVGDFVLTHKGRFRAVTNTLEHYTKRYKGEVVRIRYSNKKGKSKTLEVTPDHKFLTQRGWVRADELTKNDTLKLLVVECENCGHDISLVSGSTLCYRCKANYKFIDHPIEEITKIQVHSRKLYDITVDEDHSFVVEGIVSHNCTCPLAVLPDGFGFDKNGELVYIGEGK